MTMHEIIALMGPHCEESQNRDTRGGRLHIHTSFSNSRIRNKSASNFT